MGNVNEFEYKIHLSVSSEDIVPEVRQILKNAQMTADGEKVKIILTGDDKDLLKQLRELKREIPDLDLTDNIHIGFADALKNDTEAGREILDKFTSMIIKSINSTNSAIDKIQKKIVETKNKISQNSSMQKEFAIEDGKANPSKALKQAEERLGRYKVDKANLDNIAKAFQRVVNIQVSTGQALSSNTVQLIDNVKKILGVNLLDIVKPNRTYESYVNALKKEEYDLQNELIQLNQDLEDSKNPKVEVNGVLSKHFLEDIQNQVSRLGGVDIKVNPIIDGNVEIGASNIKLVSPHKKNNTTNNVGKTEKYTVDLDSKEINNINNKSLADRIEYLKQIKSAHSIASTDGIDAVTNQIDNAKKSLDDFRETYSSVIITLDNGESFKIVNTSESENLESVNDEIKKIDIGQLQLIEEKIKEVKFELSHDLKMEVPPDEYVGGFTSQFNKVIDDFQNGVISYEKAQKRVEEINSTIKDSYNSTINELPNGQLSFLQQSDVEFNKDNVATEYKKIMDELSKSSEVSEGDLVDFEKVYNRTIKSIERGSIELDKALEKLRKAREKILKNATPSSTPGQMSLEQFTGTEKALNERVGYRIRKNAGKILSDSEMANFNEEVNSIIRVMDEMGYSISRVAERVSKFRIDQQLNKSRLDFESLSSEDKKEVSDQATATYVQQLEEEAAAYLKIGDNAKKAAEARRKAIESSKSRSTLSSLDVWDNELQKLQELEEKERIATQKENDKNNNILLKQQEDSLKKIWKYRKELAKIDKESNKEKYTNKDNDLKEEEENYRIITKKVEALKDVVDLNEQIIKLQKIQNDGMRQVRDADTDMRSKKSKSDVSKKIDYTKQRYDIEKQMGVLDAGGKNDTSEYRQLSETLDVVNRKIQSIKLSEEDEEKVSRKTAKAKLTMEKAISDAKRRNMEDQEKASKREQDDAEKLVKKRQKILRQLVELKQNGKLMKNEEWASEINTQFNLIRSGAKVSAQYLDSVDQKIQEIIIDAKAANEYGESLPQKIAKRWESLLGYLGSFASFYRLIEYGRQAVTIIHEFDDALTEMRKVSEESTNTLKMFQNESFGIANSVGSTALVIQKSTADWMRLGESLTQAKESAKDASILLNVSEFSSIDDATTSLVAMSQAYSELDKMDIIDKLNNIGNNFSISTDQLSVGLQNAAAVLKTQGNDIDESIALITAANSIVQDVSKASAGMRTISLRIAGTETAKKELEEFGESVDDYIVQTKSKTRDMIKAYTAVASNNGKGIDVLDSNGNLRDTYHILLDISKVYKEIQEEDKKNGTNRANALVEYLAGKNRSNIAASVLSSPDLLENVYKSSSKSEGSAMEENQKYLESISGHLAQLKNSIQEVVFDTIDSDFLKFWIDVAKATTDVVKNVGLLKAILITVVSMGGAKKLGLFNYNESEGFKIGATGLAGLFNNRNEEILSSGNNSRFLDEVITKWNNSDFNAEQIKQTADNIKDVNGNLVKSVQTYKEIGVEAGKIRQIWIDSGSAASKFGSIIKSAGGILGRIGAGFGNALLSMGITALVTFAISGISSVVDKLIITKKEAKEAARTFKESFRDMVSSQAEIDKNISEIEDEFKSLSKGVDALGRNVSLTDDEFDRYHEITKIIGDNIPNLINGYDSQGNAIIRLRNNIESLSAAYDEVKRNQAIEKYNAVDDNGSGIVKSTYKELGDFYGQTTKDANTYDTIDFNGVRETYKRLATMSYEEIMAIVGDTNNILEQDLLNKANVRADMTKQEFETTSRSTLQSLYQDFESELLYHNQLLSTVAAEYARTTGAYWDDNMDSAREYFDLILSNLDYDAAIKLELVDENGRPVEQKVKDFVNTITSQLPNIDTSNIETRLNIVTAFNNNEVSYGEYLNILKQSEEWVNGLDPVIQKVLELLFRVNSIDSSAERGMEWLKKIMGENFTEDFANSLTSDEIKKVLNIEIRYSENAEEVKTGLGQVILNSSLPDFIKGKMTNALMQVDILPLIDPYSDEEVKKQIENDINPIELEPTVTAVDAVDSIADAKSAITSLNDLYQQTVENQLKLGKDKKYLGEDGSVSKVYDTSNMATGFADPALINSVESAFKGIAEDDSKVALALSEFEKTLVEFPGDAEKAQTSINELITAYIDQTDIIKNLKEENAEWSEEQLTAMGITNAHEVVISRLNKQVKETSKNIGLLADAIQKYDDKINNGEDGSEQFAKVISTAREALKMQDADGNWYEVPEIDDSFIERHMEDVRAMAAGDVEALNRIRVAAAKDAVMKVTVNVPADVAERQIQSLMNMVAQLDSMNIEVGANVNDSEFIASLNEMIKSGKYTADQVNAAFESMGYEVHYKSKEVKAIVPSKSGTHVTALPSNVPGGGTTVSWDWETREVPISIPEVDIVTKKSSGGMGAGAIYGGSPSVSSGGSGGSGGGGGGDNSNKVQKESDETFDWIEVAIKRIEEEMARLDKVVNNTYDMWGLRNDKLASELEENKRLLQAHRVAYEEYLRNANAVQVNNGRGLDDDEYSDNDATKKANDQRLLDEARAAWATGEYQKKVREGLMSGNDIENIQNHFLSDTIKNYQELYNKAVAAGDAIKDDKIKLGELANTNFDHIQKEFEDTVAYLEKFGNIIDERVNRTKEHGYFVSTSYYDDLLKLEKEKINDLSHEYESLIKSRDNSIKNGYIIEGTEAYDALNQKILEVANSLEASTTNAVKFANEIRQIKWDVFNYAEDYISKMSEEMEFLVNLLSEQKLFDDWGMFNERGWSTAGLHAAKYNVYMQQSLDYAKERVEIEKQLAQDNADQKLIDRRNELIKLQQESITNAKAEKEAVKSLIEEGINQHLSKLNEVIDEYKKALHNAKDYYDYQKNIANQTKNIGDLEKQLQAYAGDDSEETRATIQKLRKQLDDAKQQLKETEWDKYISETETFLGDMYNEYSETLKKQLDDITALMNNVINSTNEKSNMIADTLRSTTYEVGYTMSDKIDDVFGNTNNVVSTFSNNFANYAVAVLGEIGDIKQYITSISNMGVNQAADISKMNTELSKYNSERYTVNGYDFSKVFDLEFYMNKYKDLRDAFGDDYDKYFQHFIKYGMKEGRQGSADFDYATYRASNPDLEKAFGNDKAAYYNHYVSRGYSENRVHTNGAFTLSNDIYTPIKGTDLLPDIENATKAINNLTSSGMINQLNKLFPNGVADYTNTNLNNSFSVKIDTIKVAANNSEEFAKSLQSVLNNDTKTRKFVQAAVLGQSVNGSRTQKY